MKDAQCMLTTWASLCEIFSKVSVINPRPEDVAASLETWKYDHITLNYQQSSYWKSADALIQPLSTKSLLSLHELSKANASHIDAHLKTTRAIAVAIPPALYGLFGEVEPIKSAFDSFGIPILTVLTILFVPSLCFLGLLWQNKWRAMELTTYLEVKLALRRGDDAQAGSTSTSSTIVSPEC